MDLLRTQQDPGFIYEVSRLPSVQDFDDHRVELYCVELINC